MIGDPFSWAQAEILHCVQETLSGGAAWREVIGFRELGLLPWPWQRGRGGIGWSTTRCKR
jgi:hypothetical protein